jgi:hypothetical protein
VSPPTARAYPRFVAEPPSEGIPYGRWAEVLHEHFAAACKEIEDLPEGVEVPDEITWFPERAWGTRLYVPATARAHGADTEIELFGYVSCERGAGSAGPTGFTASADFTDVLAEENPDWQIDLSDEVLAPWKGGDGLTGDLTLIWGRPLVPGAVAATAEIEGEAVDQVRLDDDRFTLVAIDAVKGLGDDLFVEVKLWHKRGQALASESLYADVEDEPADSEPAQGVNDPK